MLNRIFIIGTAPGSLFIFKCDTQNSKSMILKIYTCINSTVFREPQGGDNFICINLKQNLKKN